MKWVYIVFLSAPLLFSHHMILISDMLFINVHLWNIKHPHIGGLVGFK